MLPPLPTDTVLQNRYRILNVLGQGGFGRTYLAQDQGRFNELCALKELTPAQGGTYALDKSKELFQREAEILYKIQHPQIPEFRANFEQDQRLFLVQDYVDGQTYRMLLDQRRTQGIAFSETEILQLLRQLLPVLAHIHSKGIIHRDIAPDNIILRQQDSKPVLIDFGVVKELATRLQGVGMTMPQNTTVGKLGYAPWEQIQTGKAYPSSDLYSLAVTAVVLLTGREPQELFDDSTMTWYWQRWVTVTPGFAQVLNRMLSYRPSDRYQSVSEVVQALQALPGGGGYPPTQTPPPTYQPPIVTPHPTPPPPTNPDLSRIPTVAVGRRPASNTTAPVAPANQRSATRPTIEAPRSSLWDDPWAVLVLGIAFIALTGIGSWLLVRTIFNPQAPTPTASITFSPTPSTPSPTVTPTTTPTIKPTPDPVNYSQRLEIAPDGKPIVKTGTLKENETLDYIIAAEQEDQLTAVLDGEGVLMTILGPNREPLGDRANRVSYWQGTLPYTGAYYLRLRPIKGIGQSDYQVEVRLASPPEPSPSPTIPSPSPTVSPSPSPPPAGVQEERVSFPPGQTRTTISARIEGNVIRRYLVNGNEGQVLAAEVNGGPVTLSVRGPDGRFVEGASGVVVSQSKLTIGGTYAIDVTAPPGTDFTLDISVRD
ncbi:protein kinase domain-containing protein [Pantanalinema rosaneae CENA516]|uniref:protein kinase domain-containing protein n=1 Tax=Pantanalinema rosaneae TaxID=1620701 RepID=UPI003D6DAB09